MRVIRLQLRAMWYGRNKPRGNTVLDNVVRKRGRDARVSKAPRRMIVTTCQRDIHYPDEVPPDSDAASG